MVLLPEEEVEDIHPADELEDEENEFPVHSPEAKKFDEGKEEVSG